MLRTRPTDTGIASPSASLRTRLTRSAAAGRRGHRGWVCAALASLAVAGALAGCGETVGSGGAAALGADAGSPTPASIDTARSQAKELVSRGRYAEAIAVYERAGLDEDADRVRRRGARALYRLARRALERGRYKTARRLATESHELHKLAGARRLLKRANAEIARAEAAERERRRLARIARDARTCSSSEKATVRNNGGVPSGCATYAANLAARRARREAEKAQADPAPRNDCHPSYEGACLKPDSPDYDCAGGSGDGPDYTGPVRVVGDDPYDLDRDGDGYACEG
jgi:tetratricopeptide (TPR) repeat protein